jgi:hypothetical protein
LCLKNLEDQVLFAKAAGARDFQGARNTAKFCDVLFFEFSDGHGHLRWGKGGSEEVREGDVLLGEIRWEILNATGAGRALSISQNREEKRTPEKRG